MEEENVNIDVEDDVYIDIKVYSEITGDYVGCGMDCSSLRPIQQQLCERIDDIQMTLSDSFWELIQEFEGSLEEAYGERFPGEDYDSDRIDPFDVFGNFMVSIKKDGQELQDIKLDFDANAFMYDGCIPHCSI